MLEEIHPPVNYVSKTESYDGTNWTSGPTRDVLHDRLAASGSSTHQGLCVVEENQELEVKH